MQLTNQWPIGVVLLAVAATSQAHHSRIAYDHERTVELNGTVTAISWQNPHVRIDVATRDRDGAEVVWALETSGPSALLRNHVSPDILAVGEAVQIVGHPVREPNTASAWIQSILKADGTLIELPPQGDYRRIGP